MLVSRMCVNILTGSRLGIELEMEGIYGVEDYKGWMHHDEGSLRNGVELVSAPILMEEVEGYLSRVEHLIVRATPSDRCSVHVHTNAGKMSTLGVLKQCTLYLCLERELISHYGMRGDNNYCVPFHCIQNPLEFAQNMCRSNYVINEEYNKYCALNLKPLRRFGTLEFRGMGFIDNVEGIYSWVEMVHQIREMSQCINLQKFKHGGRDYLLEISSEFPRVEEILTKYECEEGIVQAIGEVLRCAD